MNNHTPSPNTVSRFFKPGRPNDRLISVPREENLTKAHNKESDGRDCLSDMSLARNHPDFLRRSLREFGYQGEE
jgi:hypothetical protein